MKVYTVFKEGVFRHECGGIFSTFEKAKQSAIDFYNKDHDNYHSYEVIEFDLDKQYGPEIRISGSRYFSEINEPIPVFSTEKMKYDK